VIPAPVRHELGIDPGDELVVSVDDQRLVLESRAAIAAQLRGSLKHLAKGASVVDELIAERREEARREEDEIGREERGRQPRPS
jgi:AbrB family looped-hinge helix DNA binding protein